MKVINVQQAKTQLSKYLEAVANGEELILGKNNKPMAMLVPYVEKGVERKLGGVEGWISEDCWETDAELEEVVYNSSLFPEEKGQKVEEDLENYPKS